MSSLLARQQLALGPRAQRGYDNTAVVSSIDRAGRRAMNHVVPAPTINAAVIIHGVTGSQELELGSRPIVEAQIQTKRSEGPLSLQAELEWRAPGQG